MRDIPLCDSVESSIGDELDPFRRVAADSNPPPGLAETTNFVQRQDHIRAVASLNSVGSLLMPTCYQQLPWGSWKSSRINQNKSTATEVNMDETINILIESHFIGCVTIDCNVLSFGSHAVPIDNSRTPAAISRQIHISSFNYP